MSRATERGAVLSAGVVASRIALVYTACDGCGSVDVFLGSTKLARVDTGAASTRARRVATVAVFTRARSGTVRVVVASSGRPVKIDGLAIRLT